MLLIFLFCQLETMMPAVSEDMQEQLANLVEHYDELVRIRQEQGQDNEKGSTEGVPDSK